MFIIDNIIMGVLHLSLFIAISYIFIKRTDLSILLNRLILLLNLFIFLSAILFFILAITAQNSFQFPWFFYKFAIIIYIYVNYYVYKDMKYLSLRNEDLFEMNLKIKKIRRLLELVEKELRT